MASAGAAKAEFTRIYHFFPAIHQRLLSVRIKISLLETAKDAFVFSPREFVASSS
jgi:hypothetical protein